MKKLFVAVCLGVVIGGAGNVQAAVSFIDDAFIRKIVAQFLTREAKALANVDQVKIEVGHLDSRLKLSLCDQIEAFLPPSSKVWGKISVGVRCILPQKWTVYIPSVVSIWGTYYVSAHALSKGQTIMPDDIQPMQGDLATLPHGAVREAKDAIGKIAPALAAGMVLKEDNLRQPSIVLQGQNIRVRFSGEGFSVMSDGQALNNASEGQLVKVKVQSGQVLSGVAKPDGVVQINH